MGSCYFVRMSERESLCTHQPKSLKTVGSILSNLGERLLLAACKTVNKWQERAGGQVGPCVRAGIAHVTSGWRKCVLQPVSYHCARPGGDSQHDSTVHLLQDLHSNRMGHFLQTMLIHADNDIPTPRERERERKRTQKEKLVLKIHNFVNMIGFLRKVHL